MGWSVATSSKPVLAAGIIATFFTAIIGCGSGGGSGGTAPLEPVQKLLLPPSGQPVSVDVRANRTERFVFTYQLPPTATRIASATIDGPATLGQVTRLSPVSVKALARRLFPAASGPATDNVRALFRVGNDPERVCSSAKVYGPYNASILGSSLGFATGSPTSATADDQTLQIVNLGPLAVCMEILSTIDASFSVNGVAWDVTSADCGAPGNFDGHWTGTYSCENSCTGEPFGGGIDLTVSQDGSVASYTDNGGVTFSGTVCGQAFRFEQASAFETERGIMTLDNATSATKRSTWRTNASPFCGGDCVDRLHR